MGYDDDEVYTSKSLKVELSQRYSDHVVFVQHGE